MHLIACVLSGLFCKRKRSSSFATLLYAQYLALLSYEACTHTLVCCTGIIVVQLQPPAPVLPAPPLELGDGSVGIIVQPGPPSGAEVPPECGVMAVGSRRPVPSTPCGTVAPSGTDDDTAVVQAALDECAGKGGGKVTLANGTYKLAKPPLLLRSYVTLHLSGSTTLQGPKAPGFGEYVEFDPDEEVNGVRHPGLLYASNIQAFGVTADLGGTIDGQGKSWWTKRGPKRPDIILVTNSTDFVVQNVYITKSPGFCIYMLLSIYGTIEGVRIRNPSSAPNTDGIDTKGSSHIEIKNVDVSTGDDQVAIKGSKAGILTDVYVHDSIFGKGHGISVGSGVYRGVVNVCIANNVIDGGNNGLRIKSSVGRGGAIRRYVATNNIIRKVKTAAICITETYNSKSDGKSPQDPDTVCDIVTGCIPDFGGMTFKNLTVQDGDVFFDGDSIEATFLNCELGAAVVYSTQGAQVTGVANVSRTITDDKYGSICD